MQKASLKVKIHFNGITFPGHVLYMTNLSVVLIILKLKYVMGNIIKMERNINFSDA